MNVWMIVTVCYTKQFADGSLKRVNEPYIVAASTFTDAEARIYQVLGETIRGEFYVKSIARIELMDIFANEEDNQEWFKVTISHMAADAYNEKIKKISSPFLVQSTDCIQAGHDLKFMLADSIMDYELKSVVSTKIVEVFPYEESANTGE